MRLEGVKKRGGDAARSDRAPVWGGRDPPAALVVLVRGADPGLVADRPGRALGACWSVEDRVRGLERLRGSPVESWPVRVAAQGLGLVHGAETRPADWSGLALWGGVLVSR